MAFTTRHLRPVPDPHEQRGGEVIEKFRDLFLKSKATAKREVLSDLAEHYMQEPGKPLLSYEVAELMIERAEAIEGAGK